MDLFVPIDPTSGDHAAASIALSIADPQEIAAAASGAGPGDNANAKLLAGIADEKLFSSASETANDNYAGLVYSIGADAKTVDDGVQTEKQAIEQLQNLRDSLSGVNMDEEAVNVLKYQKVYQACAECVKTLNTLSDSILAMIG